MLKVLQIDATFYSFALDAVVRLINVSTSYYMMLLPTVSHKTPSCVLLDKDQNFMSFGYQAEDKYNQIAQDDKKDHREYYYFRRFKMILHSRSVRTFTSAVATCLAITS